MSVFQARKLRKRLTEEEAWLWSVLRTLRPQGLPFRRQVPILGYIVDFACHSRRLIVELDGSQHYEPEHAQADEDRDARLGSIGYRIHRFPNGELRADPDGVIDGLIRLARPLPLEGRGNRAKGSGRGSARAISAGEPAP